MKSIKTILFYVVLIITVCLLMASCYTEKKAVRQAAKAMNEKPLNILPLFRGKFPCVDLNKSDTVIVNTDTTIWVDCPDTIPSTECFTVHDTLIKKVQLPAKTIRIPVTLPVKTVTIVKEIEDFSRIVEKDIQLAESQKKIDELQKSNDRWKKLFFILLGIAVISWIPYILKAIKFFKP